MTRRPMPVAIAIILTILAVTTACVSSTQIQTTSPASMQEFKLVSAGHTGCSPAENDITNFAVDRSGNGTWNATCKGKTYLCASVGSGGSGVDYYSCAPVAQ